MRLLHRLRALNARPNPLIVAGFSGGADSLALAAALGRMSASGEVRVALLHVDHGLRNASSEDAERAAWLAESLGVPISVKRLPPGLRGRTKGVGTEEAARRERYLAFREVVEELNADLLALGHHRQDQIESILLHLVRGAGLNGAAGMTEVARVVVPWWTDANRSTIDIWRPLLTERRIDIEAYVARSGMTPVEDESNSDRSYLRNWLRHDLVPSLERRVPGAGDSLVRFAEIAAGDDALLESLAESLLSRSVDGDGRLVWTSVSGESVALIRRVVRLWLARLLPDPEVSRDRIEAVIGLSRRGETAKTLELGGGAIAALDDGLVTAGSRSSVFAALRKRFDGPLAHDGFENTRLQSGTPIVIDGWRILATGEGTLRVRTARDGDRFALTGAPVREWSRTHALHPLLRDRLLLAETADGVVWAAGRNDRAEIMTAAGGVEWRFALSKIEEVG